MALIDLESGLPVEQYDIWDPDGGARRRVKVESSDASVLPRIPGQIIVHPVL